MKKEGKKSTLKRTVLAVAGGVALTAAGLIVIPPLVAKYANKSYKSSLENESIDFDDMGPEIVPFPEETADEDGE